MTGRSPVDEAQESERRGDSRSRHGLDLALDTDPSENIRPLRIGADDRQLVRLEVTDHPVRTLGRRTTVQRLGRTPRVQGELQSISPSETNLHLSHVAPPSFGRAL